MECKSYIENQIISEFKEILFSGFKHIKTDKIDKFILFGCESDELYENNERFKLWSNNFMNAEIQKRKIKITGWPIMNLVKRNNFFKTQRICLKLNNAINQECDVELFVIFNCCLFTKNIYMSL